MDFCVSDGGHDGGDDVTFTPISEDAKRWCQEYDRNEHSFTVSSTKGWLLAMDMADEGLIVKAAYTPPAWL
jgi:hypothetical protein